MSTQSDVQEVANRLRGSLKSIYETSPETYLRSELKGFSFQNISQEIDQLLGTCRQLANANLEAVLPLRLEQLINRALQVDNILRPLAAFDPYQDVPNNPQKTPKVLQRELANAVAQAAPNHITDMMATISAYPKKSDQEAILLEAKLALSSAQQTKDQLVAELTKANQQAKDILKSIRESSGKTGVAEHANIFSAQAAEHYEASKKWLCACAIILCGGLTFVWLFFIGRFKPVIPPTAENAPLVAEAIYNVTSRLLFFSLISYAAYWAAKNFGSHRHNYIVNKHRQNALGTFQVFVNGTNDQKIKDVVLAQASQTIFTAQQSGYMDNETMPTIVGAAEIIKTMISR